MTLLSVAEAARLVEEAVTAPGIDQSVGSWREDGRCCMGSRIAHALGVETPNYLNGVDEWARLMGATRAQVILMLRDAGAGPDPLGPARWQESPRAVWRRLESLREMPRLHHRDLSRQNLARTDLRDSDLAGTRLYRANLRGAELDNADLTRADLRAADLAGASLRCARMRDADLRGADLTGADISKANLNGARTEGAVTVFTNAAGTGLETRRRREELRA